MKIIACLVALLRKIFLPDMSTEEVAAALDTATSGRNLDWRNSVVDLLKAVHMDSSLEARKRLAVELGYDGDFDGSAKANIWLHDAVLRELAKHEIKLPAR